MVIKLKNNVEDVETFLKYYYLNHFGWKIYSNSLYIIGVLSPIIVNIYDTKRNIEFYSNTSMMTLNILITICMTLFFIYLFLKLIPKLLMKRLKKRSIKYYKKKKFFSVEKIIEVKNDSIEVNYDNKKLIIPLNKDILVDEFNGSIIISVKFLKNKIKKVYPLVIPVTTFKSKESKEEFIKDIEEKKMLH
ncbi:hypothetical protein NX821_001019 [Clostridium septicum]|uniref:hypothetical protein n=1 Tax=Clostridium septicum TaxID=1504 RepID=UPI0032177E77